MDRTVLTPSETKARFELVAGWLAGSAVVMIQTSFCCHYTLCLFIYVFIFNYCIFK